jgi:hypothetical protein
MVNSINQSQPDNLGGVTPADFNVLSNEYFASLEFHKLQSDKLIEEMVALEQLFIVIEHGESQLIGYALEKYNLTEVISTEDADRAAMQAWERVKVNMRRFQSDLFGYAKVIQSGSERLVERLEMLAEMANKANSKPFKEEVAVKKNAKFSINGGFQPKDIRPVLEGTNNLFDFYDRVLLPFLKQADKLLSTVQTDQTWADDGDMRFELFEASKWMKNFTPLEEPDDRFRASAFVVRGVTAQGEKALYYAGPKPDDSEHAKDWGYFINVVRSLRLRYVKVPDVVPVNGSDSNIKVDPPTTIRQRVSYLLGIAKRIAARKGYDQKISTEMRKLERSADKIRNGARNMKPTLKDGVGGDLGNDDDDNEEQGSQPNTSKIVQDLTTIMNSMTRLVSDYNNAVAGQLRLLGAMGFIADLELKAYEAPMDKPEPEVQAKLDQ